MLRAGGKQASPKTRGRQVSQVVQREAAVAAAMQRRGVIRRVLESVWTAYRDAKLEVEGQEGEKYPLFDLDEGLARAVTDRLSSLYTEYQDFLDSGLREGGKYYSLSDPERDQVIRADTVVFVKNVLKDLVGRFQDVRGLAHFHEKAICARRLVRLLFDRKAIQGAVGRIRQGQSNFPDINESVRQNFYGCTSDSVIVDAELTEEVLSNIEKEFRAVQEEAAQYHSLPKVFGSGHEHGDGAGPADDRTGDGFGDDGFGGDGFGDDGDRGSMSGSDDGDAGGPFASALRVANVDGVDDLSAQAGAAAGEGDGAGPADDRTGDGFGDDGFGGDGFGDDGDRGSMSGSDDGDVGESSGQGGGADGEGEGEGAVHPLVVRAQELAATDFTARGARSVEAVVTDMLTLLDQARASEEAATEQAVVAKAKQLADSVQGCILNPALTATRQNFESFVWQWRSLFEAIKSNLSPDDEEVRQAAFIQVVESVYPRVEATEATEALSQQATQVVSGAKDADARRAAVSVIDQTLRDAITAVDGAREGVGYPDPGEPDPLRAAEDNVAEIRNLAAQLAKACVVAMRGAAANEEAARERGAGEAPRQLDDVSQDAESVDILAEAVHLRNTVGAGAAPAAPAPVGPNPTATRRVLVSQAEAQSLRRAAAARQPATARQQGGMGFGAEDVLSGAPPLGTGGGAGEGGGAGAGARRTGRALPLSVPGPGEGGSDGHAGPAGSEALGQRGFGVGGGGDTELSEVGSVAGSGGEGRRSQITQARAAAQETGSWLGPKSHALLWATTIVVPSLLLYLSTRQGNSVLSEGTTADDLASQITMDSMFGVNTTARVIADVHPEAAQAALNAVKGVLPPVFGQSTLAGAAFPHDVAGDAHAALRGWGVSTDTQSASWLYTFAPLLAAAPLLGAYVIEHWSTRSEIPGYRGPQGNGKFARWMRSLPGFVGLADLRYGEVNVGPWTRFFSRYGLAGGVAAAALVSQYLAKSLLGTTHPFGDSQQPLLEVLFSTVLTPETFQGLAPEDMHTPSQACADLGGNPMADGGCATDIANKVAEAIQAQFGKGAGENSWQFAAALGAIVAAMGVVYGAGKVADHFRDKKSREKVADRVGDDPADEFEAFDHEAERGEAGSAAQRAADEVSERHLLGVSWGEFTGLFQRCRRSRDGYQALGVPGAPERESAPLLESGTGGSGYGAAGRAEDGTPERGGSSFWGNPLATIRGWRAAGDAGVIAAPRRTGLAPRSRRPVSDVQTRLGIEVDWADGVSTGGTDPALTGDTASLSLGSSAV